MTDWTRLKILESEPSETAGTTLSWTTGSVASLPSVSYRTVVTPKPEVSPLLPELLFRVGAAPFFAVVREAIEGLLRSRRFLALQLDQEWGNVDEQEYQTLANEYFSTQERQAPSDLLPRIVMLSCVAPGAFDADSLSQALGLRFEDAEAALTHAATLLKASSTVTMQFNAPALAINDGDTRT